MLLFMVTFGHHLPTTPPHPSWCVGMGNVPDQVEGASKGPEGAESPQTGKTKRGIGKHR